MIINQQNKEFEIIIKNILKNKDFNKLKLIEHHGITRYDHSLKVSYYSYLITKKLKLDYIETARAGLLHDFFLSPEVRTNKEKFISTFIHPKEAVKIANKHFNLTNKEKDIIRSHMFPINISVPKYLESWIVSIVDKVVAINEFSLKFKFQFRYTYNFLLLFIISIIK